MDGSLAENYRVLRRLSRRYLSSVDHNKGKDFYTPTPETLLTISRRSKTVRLTVEAIWATLHAKDVADSSSAFKGFSFGELQPFLRRVRIPDRDVDTGFIDHLVAQFDFAHSAGLAPDGTQSWECRDLEEILDQPDGATFVAWLSARWTDSKGVPPRLSAADARVRFGNMPPGLVGKRLVFLRALVEAAEYRTDVGVDPSGVAADLALATELDELENYLRDNRLIEGMTADHVAVTRYAIDIIEGLEGSDEVPEVPGTDAREKTAPKNDSIVRLFVSHDEKDVAIAHALVDLIEALLVVPTGTLRCTSVPGYMGDPGDATSEILRADLHNADVVLGLVTPKSLASKWVLLELGAAWGFEKIVISLLPPGVDFSDLPGPFKDVSAVQLTNASRMANVLEKIIKHCGMSKRGDAARWHAKLDDFAKLAASWNTSSPPGASPANKSARAAPSVPADLSDDAVRMKLIAWLKRNVNMPAGRGEPTEFSAIDDAAGVPPGATERMLARALKYDTRWSEVERAGGYVRLRHSMYPSRM
jgi:hypothetical protein